MACAFGVEKDAQVRGREDTTMNLRRRLEWLLAALLVVVISAGSALAQDESVQNAPVMQYPEAGNASAQNPDAQYPDNGNNAPPRSVSIWHPKQAELGEP